MPTATAFTAIPTISLPTATPAEVVRACHEVGFFHLVDHPIDQDFLDAHHEHRMRFFSLPEEVKARIDKVTSPHFRGWERVGAELTNGVPDLREQIDLASENPVRGLRADPPYLRLDGPNQWLGEEVMPGFRAHMTEWFERFSDLAVHLMELISEGLGLDRHHLRGVFGEWPFSLTKVIHYPPTPDGGAGVNAHHDAGFLTLLVQHEVAGLQALNPDGDWIDVPPTPGAIVVNLGEMLQEMTGNYVVAATHRVIAGDERYSSAYFHGPDLTTRLDPLPLDAGFAAAVAASERHRSAGFMAKREEIEGGGAGIASAGAGVFGQQLWNYYRRSYPENVARHHPDCS